MDFAERPGNYAVLEGLTFLLAPRELRELRSELSSSNSLRTWVTKASISTGSGYFLIRCLARLFSSWTFFG